MVPPENYVNRFVRGAGFRRDFSAYGGHRGAVKTIVEKSVLLRSEVELLAAVAEHADGGGLEEVAAGAEFAGATEVEVF